MPAGAIYVGRPTRFGNPFVGQNAALWFEFWLALPRATMAEVVAAAARGGELTIHSRYDEFRYFPSRDFLPCLEALRGKDLVCWCPLDRPCHADVILGLLDRMGAAAGTVTPWGGR
jgi:hypothetical protein